MKKKITSFRWKLVFTYMLICILCAIFIFAISFKFIVDYFTSEKIDQITEELKIYANNIGKLIYTTGDVYDPHFRIKSIFIYKMQLSI